jgi:hypothetical protein
MPGPFITLTALSDGRCIAVAAESVRVMEDRDFAGELGRGVEVTLESGVYYAVAGSVQQILSQLEKLR